MAYWHRTLGNTKVQKRISDFGKTPPLPTSGHGFPFRHPLVDDGQFCAFGHDYAEVLSSISSKKMVTDVRSQFYESGAIWQFPTSSAFHTLMKAPKHIVSK